MLGLEIGCDDPQDDHREEMNQCVDRLERALDGLFVGEDEKAAARLWGPSPPASD